MQTSRIVGTADLKLDHLHGRAVKDLLQISTHLELLCTRRSRGLCRHLCEEPLGVQHHRSCSRVARLRML